MDYRKIDFDKELDRGPRTYEKKLGRWWMGRSNDAPHAYAYRNIVAEARAVAKGKFGTIVDYGCGGGHVLTRLYKAFPKSRIVGIDGSAYMLGQTGRRLQRIDADWRSRVDLIQSYLPNFSLPRGADLLFFVFPNIVPDSEEDDEDLQTAGDRKVAKYLSKAREEDPEEETVEDDDETLYDSMITDNTIARNLRRMLKRGGICVRAEYANARREELTRLVQLRMAFQEGSLAERVDGHKAKQFFALLGSSYHRSKVIEDVYHQTRDKSDREGGYLLSTLVAV